MDCASPLVEYFHFLYKKSSREKASIADCHEVARDMRALRAPIHKRRETWHESHAALLRLIGRLACQKHRLLLRLAKNLFVR